jgi:hypothetical protein
MDGDSDDEGIILVSLRSQPTFHDASQCGGLMEAFMIRTGFYEK